MEGLKDGSLRLPLEAATSLASWAGVCEKVFLFSLTLRTECVHSTVEGAGAPLTVPPREAGVLGSSQGSGDS